MKSASEILKKYGVEESGTRSDKKSISAAQERIESRKRGSESAESAESILSRYGVEMPQRKSSSEISRHKSEESQTSAVDLLWQRGSSAPTESHYMTPASTLAKDSPSRLLSDLSAGRKNNQYKTAEDVLAQSMPQAMEPLSGPAPLDRIEQTVKSGAERAASGLSAAASSLYGLTQGMRTAQNEDYLKDYKYTLDRAQNDLDTMLAEEAATPGTYTPAEIQGQRSILEDAQRKYDAMAKVIGDQIQEQAASGALDVAEQARRAGARDVEKASEGLGTLGRGIVNVGSGLTEMGLETLAGGGLFGRALGQYGSSALDAREAGLPEDKQAIAGAISAAGVLAGSALSKGVDAAGLNLLRKLGKQNDILPNILLGGATASGYAVGNTGLDELAKAITQEDYQPDLSAIGSNALTAFAFGAIRQTVRVARTSAQNKAYIESLNAEVQRRYEFVKGVMANGTLEQQAEAARSVMNGTAELYDAISKLRVVGAADEVNAISSFLISINQEMEQIAAGYRAAPTTPATSGGAMSVIGLSSPRISTGTAQSAETAVGGPVPSPASTASAAPASTFSLTSARAPSVIEAAIRTDADGTISGKTADKILADAEAVSALKISDDMSKSQKRSAAKEAVASLVHTSADGVASSSGNNTLSRNTADAVGQAGRDVMESMRLPSQDPADYRAVMMGYYRSGLESRGKAFSGTSKNIVAPLTEGQAKAAYIAGQADARGTASASAGADIGTDTNIGGVLSNAAAMDLRKGGQWDNSADTVGAVSRVESGAGQNQGGALESRPADAGAASLSYGEEVTIADMGIPGGSTADKVRLVTGGETEATAAAQSHADDRGLELVMFGGGNLSITLEDGTVVSAPAHIVGNRVFVRTDHPEYTADQFMRHEAGHDMIDKGEISPDEVWSLAQKKMDAGRMQEAIALYESAYRGTKLTPSQIWVEAICDSLGDMNIFSGMSLEDTVGQFLDNTKAAAVGSMQAPHSGRGPPADTAGKSSWDLAELRQMREAAKRFADVIDEWDAAGRKSGEFFNIGTTGSVLQGLGAIESDIYMTGDKIKDILHDHPEMTLAEIKRIPEILEDPVLILKSRNVKKAKSQYGESRLPMFGTVKAQDGRQVMCVMDLRPTENGLLLEDMQKVNSAYTKDTDPVNFVKSSPILYADKKRTIPLLRGMGFQMPMSLLRSGSIGSIKYSGKSVNIQGVPFSSVVDTTQPKTQPSGSFSHALESMEELRAEARRLKELAARKTKQAEYWRGQTRRTTAETRELVQKDVNRLARQLREDFSSKAKFKDLVSLLNDLGEYLLRGEPGSGEISSQTVWEKALGIGWGLVENAVKTDEYSELRNYLQTAKLTISPQDSSDIADFESFRKRYFGKLSISGGQTNIDQIYQELSEQWPYFFNEQQQSAPSDQLLHIAEVLDSLSGIDEAYSLDTETAVQWAAETVLDGIMSEDVRQAPPTFADRQARQMEAVAARGKQAVARERTRRQEQVQQLKEHYAEVRRTQSARRADSKARTRLLKIVKRLQSRKLPAVNRALLDQYISEIDTVSKGITGASVEKLSALREWYDDQKQNDPDFIADPAIEQRLRRLSTRKISDMSPEEVADLTEILLHIENELQTKRKLIDSQDRRDTYLMGAEVVQNLMNVRGTGTRGAGSFLDRFIVTETLSPLRQIRRMTGYVDSDPLFMLTNALADGQRAMLDYQMRAQKPFRKYAENKAFSHTFSGKAARSIEITGQGKDEPVTVRISPAMRASLYLHSLNDQNLRHIKEGGITVPDWTLYQKGKLAEAYARGVTIKLTPSQVRAIAANMSTQERAFALEVSRYFSEVSQPAINEVSEKLKGYSIAQVEHYFPINTDTSFTKSDFESLKFDGTIEGMGFLKERVKASNPILLRDVNAVLEQSIQQHSKYVGLAIPIRNFNKVWSVTTGSFREDGSRSNFESGVQKAVKGKWGEAGYQYIEKMISDLQNGPAQKNVWAKLLNWIRSNYARAVLTLNASVAMKQAASYPTAAAVLGWRPLVRAMGDVGKVDLDLIAKYTPLQWYRSQGFSTRELGDLKTAGRQLPAMLNWVQGIDLATTRKLWKACEYYVRANNKGLSIGTDAYYRAVAEIYNRVIEETQPNYTTMQRPQLLRSDDTLMGNLALFKTQPFQNFNILYDATANLVAKDKQFKAGAAKKDDVKAAWKGFSNAVTSQLAQLAVFAGMTAAWALFRGKMGKYKDKDGELSLQSVMAGLGKDMAGGVFSMVPFGSDAWELLSSKLFGDQYYGMDAVTVTAVSDTISAIFGMAELLSGTVKSVAADENVNWNAARLKLDGYLDDISKVAGVSYENMANLFNASFRQISIKILGKYQGEYAALKLTTDPEQHSGDYYDLLYQALQESPGEYQTIYNDMLNWGFTEDKIRKNMEKRMKDSQGVRSVENLEHRYLSPSEQSDYDAAIQEMGSTKVWRQANTQQRKNAEDRLYDLTVGNSAGAELEKKISAGAAYGLTSTEYILFKMALEIVDQPSESGKLGTYTNDEVEAAIKMLTGLTNAERKYLWTAQGRNDKSNPWG